MATLLYSGFNSDGRRVGGSGSFASEERLKEYLDAGSIANYSIFKSQTTYKRGDYKLVSPKELSIFCKQMSVLFFSHMTLMEGITVLTEQTDNKQLKTALKEIYEFMEKGFTFAEAMGMYEHLFTSYLINMVYIGETSGTLETIFAQMSSYFDKEHKIRKNIRSAVTYPAVLSALMAAIIVLLIVKILPMFGDILESMGAQMPPSARIILNAGTFLSKYGLAILFAAALLIFVFAAYVRTNKGRLVFDNIKLSFPAYKYVYSRIITSRFSRSLSILLKSGVQLLNALYDVTDLTDNKRLEEKIKTATKKIEQGEKPEIALGEIDVFPPLFLKLFVIGERSGNLDEMLEKSASVFDDEADDAIKRFSDMLEPVLIIVLSVIVGIILMSVMLPIINIVNSIG